MNSLLISIVVLIWFYLGYRFYGGYIEKRLVEPDDSRATPSHSRNDGVDFVPARKSFLWGHHFASIAGAGPIIGPILAVSFFGWGYTTLWIALGCVFIGAVHDYLSLMLSVRNRGEGIAEVTGVAVGRRTRIVFAILLWLALVFIVTVFAVGGAKALMGKPELVIPTLGVIAVALGLGMAIYRFHLNVTLASAAAVILAYVLIWVGYHNPVSFPASWGQKSILLVWLGILFTYCLVASLLPVWMLLQPRDFISSFKLFIGLGLGYLGILIAQPVINAPFSRGGFFVGGKPIWPLLFVIVACGAVSGFHTMVSTGTTSKQLDKETHGKAVGYGGMIMEGVLAFLVVMIVSCGLKWGLAPEGTPPEQALNYFGNALSKNWIIAFGTGFGNIVGSIRLPWLGAGFFGLMGAVMVKTFVLTSLDTSTRLGRFIFSETIARNSPLLTGRFVSTMTLLVPAFLLSATNTYGNIWKMFGASNQLIAAIALITISAYLAGVKKPRIYTLLPALFMTATTVCALLWGVFNPQTGYLVSKKLNLPLGIISLALVALAAMVAADGLKAINAYRSNTRAPIVELAE